MASTAITAQGTTLVVGATGTSKTVSAATSANPIVLTITSHGYSDGTIVKITGISGGMTELNNKVGVVKTLTANSVQLGGINSTGWTTFTGTATATPNTFTIGNVRSFTVGGASKTQVDITNLASTAREYQGGLADSGNASAEFDVKYSDEGQMALWSGYYSTGINIPVVITYSDSKTQTISAEVMSFDENGAVDDVIRGTSTLKISGNRTRSA